MERKLGLRNFVSGTVLFGLSSCGAEGSSTKGCKSDSDCKGDRYCDEKSHQCVDDEPGQNTPLNIVLNEEFDSSTLDYHWSSANCADGECPDWNNNCKGNCPAVKEEDYIINNGVLEMKDSLAYGIGELGAGIVLEYKVRNIGSKLGYTAGLRNGSEGLFIGCWDNSSSIICDISGSSGISPYKKTFSGDLSQWQTVKIDANAQMVRFTVGDQTQEIAPSRELGNFDISSFGLYLYLFEEGEYDYVKAWKE